MSRSSLVLIDFGNKGDQQREFLNNLTLNQVHKLVTKCRTRTKKTLVGDLKSLIIFIGNFNQVN